MAISFTKKNKVFTLPPVHAPLFDTHAHLRSFWGEDKDPIDVLVRAHESGVHELMTIFDPIVDKSEETPDALAFSRWLHGVIDAAADRGAEVRVRYLVGVHPYGTLDYTDELHAQVAAALDDPLCAGIGEIGLDYHFDADDQIEAAPHAAQMDVMARQLSLAVERNVPVELDGALDTAVLHVIVHTVQATQQGRLAAAGRPDERGDLALGNIDRNVLQRMMVAIVQVHVLDGDTRLVHRGDLAPRTGGDHGHVTPLAQGSLLGRARHRLGAILGRVVHLRASSHSCS